MTRTTWASGDGESRSARAAGRWLYPLAGALLAASASHGSTVTTTGVFIGYSGPVGAPIYAGSPPARDPAQYDSYFAVGVGSAVQQINLVPQNPYPGYEDPAFAGTGTAVGGFPGSPIDASRVEFWSRIADSFDEAHNVIQIAGTTTPNVAAGDLFMLATISFTNGNWFRAEPPYDPGLGPLYPESHFQFVVFATANPSLGGSATHAWADTLVLRSVAGAGTPDHLSFLLNPSLGAFTVAEGVAGTVEVWGYIGSLVPVELRNPSAGVTLIPVPEANLGTLLCAAVLAAALRRSRRAKA